MKPIQKNFRQMRWPWLPIAVLAIVALLVYHPVMEFEYVWDDHILFLESSDLRPGSIRVERIFEPILTDTTYFRPLVLLSVLLEFLAFGVDSKVSHAVNLVIFILNVSVVYLIASKLVLKVTDPRTAIYAAVIGSLMYLLSPVNVEPVAWVAGRFDLTVTFFVLLAIYSGLFGSNWLVTHLVSSLCFIFGLLSKEMAVTFPAIFFLLSWINYNLNTGVRWAGFFEYFRLQFGDNKTRWQYLLYALAFVIYLGLRVYFIPQILHTDMVSVSHLTPITWVAYIGLSEIFYVKKLLLPFIDLGPHHPFNIGEVGTKDVVVGVFAPVATVMGLLFLYRKSEVVAIFLIAVLIAFAPVLNIIPLTTAGSIGHDRFMLLPGALFAIGTSVGISLIYNNIKDKASIRDNIYRGKRLQLYSISFCAVWLFVSGFNTHITLPLWGNNYALWKWSFARNPDDELSRFMYAVNALDAGKVTEYLSLVQMPPKSPSDALVYASFLTQMKKCDEAIPILNQLYYKDAGDHFKKQPVYYLLAECHLRLRSFNEALAVSERGIREFPGFFRSYFFRAFALYGLNRQKDGDIAFDEAMRRSAPGEKEAWQRNRQIFLVEIAR